ncbi:hypothetical protein HYS28_01580 [Candidatus Uhrbacteria bacterium]|nr:hypothetical protein [Candidatus Uhrbacteria bacterium]
MLKLVSEHPQAFLTLFTIVCIMALVLLAVTGGLLYEWNSTRATLKDRVEEVANLHTLMEQGKAAADGAIAEAHASDAAKLEAEARVRDKEHERRRLDGYVDGILLAFHTARSVLGERDFAPFVRLLSHWAVEEAKLQNIRGRDRFVDHALRVACEEHLVTPEILAELPPEVIERTVRHRIRDLQKHGAQGWAIVEHALALPDEERPAAK